LGIPLICCRCHSNALVEITAVTLDVGKFGVVVEQPLQ
jgi:hypothetical protein